MSQSSLVKLVGRTGYLSLDSAQSKLVRIHPQDKMCVLVDAGEVTRLKDGTLVEEGIIEANQTVLVKPNVPLKPTRFHALVSYNPALKEKGAIVTSPLIVRPGEENNISLLVRTTKKLDMTELGHVFEIYLID